MHAPILAIMDPISPGGLCGFDELPWAYSPGDDDQLEEDDADCMSLELESTFLPCVGNRSPAQSQCTETGHPVCRPEGRDHHQPDGGVSLQPDGFSFSEVFDMKPGSHTQTPMTLESLLEAKLAPERLQEVCSFEQVINLTIQALRPSLSARMRRRCKGKKILPAWCLLKEHSEEDRRILTTRLRQAHPSSWRTSEYLFSRIVAALCRMTTNASRNFAHGWWTQKANREHHWKWQFLNIACDQPEVKKALEEQIEVLKADAEKPVGQEKIPGDPGKANQKALPFGCLMTYNTKFGLDNDYLQALVAEGLPCDVLRLKIAELPMVAEYFKSFCDFVGNLAGEMGWQSVSCCLELSESAQQEGRMHLHAYLGTNIKGGPSAMSRLVRATFKPQDVKFGEITPVLRMTLTQRQHVKTAFLAVSGGMYYVLADKASTILRWGTLWPVQDLEFPSVFSGKQDPAESGFTLDDLRSSSRQAN